MDNRTSRNTRVLALGATSVLLIVSAFSAAAVAAPVPPGYSAVDQYTEAYPGVGGDNKPPAGNGTETSGSIPAKTVDRFEQAGPSGAAAVALALAITKKLEDKKMTGIPVIFFIALAGKKLASQIPQ